MSTGVVFTAGIVSVFVGMALLYLSIKLTAFVVDRLDNRKRTEVQGG